MFNIDDVVVYGTEGICRVTGITEMKFGGEKSEYYILAPVEKEENTVYVPKNNEKILQRMRKILSAEEANHLIASLLLQTSRSRSIQYCTGLSGTWTSLLVAH